MNRVTILAFLALSAVMIGQESNSRARESRTIYSRKAASLDAAFEHPVRVISPDGKKTLVVRTVEDSGDPDGPHIDYTFEVAGKAFIEKLLGFNGEVTWSPDSKAIAITQTEGGGGLGFRVYVFYVEKSRITKLDVSRPIENDFGNPVRCDVSVLPNTGFISWKGGSSLLVAAQVVPVSICDCSGAYRVYEMSLPILTISRHTHRQKRESNSRTCWEANCAMLTTSA